MELSRGCCDFFVKENGKWAHLVQKHWGVQYKGDLKASQANRFFTEHWSQIMDRECRSMKEQPFVKDQLKPEE